MKKETPKKTNNEIQKILTPEEAKQFVFDCCVPEKTVDRILIELGKKTIPEYGKTEGKKQQELSKKILQDAEIILRAHENQSRYALMESLNENYQGLAKELSKEITKEYNCTTSIEKSLVGTITNAYIRVLDHSRRLNNELNGVNITHERNTYISNLSVQVDRANRQFLQAITTLKQLKAPSIGINIKTNNAFVAQNQQLNDNKTNNETE